MKMLKEREQQRAAEGNLGRQESKANPASSSSQCDGAQVHGGTGRGNGFKKSPRQLSANFLSVSGAPPKVATRAGSKKYPYCNSILLFLHRSSQFVPQQVQWTLALIFSRQLSRSLIDAVIDVVLLSHVLHRQYTERKELLFPYHIHTLRSSHTTWLHFTRPNSSASRLQLPPLSSFVFVSAGVISATMPARCCQTASCSTSLKK